MESRNKIEFKSGIIQEYSGVSNLDDLGMANCSMELFLDDDREHGQIEWIIEYENGGVGVEHIGLWFEKKTLTDYDGLFSLPKEAIKLIRKNGFHVSRDFE